MARAKPAVVADEPVAEKKAKVDLPALGDTVIYHAFDGVDYPLIVTKLHDETFDGQAFLDGTQRQFIEAITLGDAAGTASRK